MNAKKKKNLTELEKKEKAKPKLSRRKKLKKKKPPRFISKGTDKVKKVNGEGFTYQVESPPQRNRKG